MLNLQFHKVQMTFSLIPEMGTHRSNINTDGRLFLRQYSILQSKESSKSRNQTDMSIEDVNSMINIIDCIA
jgi:hypothetical protein